MRVFQHVLLFVSVSFIGAVKKVRQIVIKGGGSVLVNASSEGILNASSEDILNASSEDTLRESVPCFDKSDRKSKRLVLLSSNGPAVSPGDAVALKELISRLRSNRDKGGPLNSPGACPDVPGIQSTPKLLPTYRDEALFSDLRVVVLNDACWLKYAMLSSKYKVQGGLEGTSAMEQQYGLRNEKLHGWTAPDLVEKYVNAEFPFDDSFCWDWKAILGDLGANVANVHQVSIFDVLATSVLKEEIMQLQSSDGAGLESLAHVTAPPSEDWEPWQVEALKPLENADLLIMNSGNPDFGLFILKHYANDLLRDARLLERIDDGEVIYYGISAGAMIGGLDVVASFEPNPALYNMLLQPSSGTEGLGLVGKCFVRPHYSEKWDLLLATYEAEQNKEVNEPRRVAVRIPNGEALQCIGSSCVMIGHTCRQGKSTHADSSRFVNLQRLMSINEHAVINNLNGKHVLVQKFYAYVALGVLVCLCCSCTANGMVLTWKRS